jgi:hypothetical protein
MDDKLLTRLSAAFPASTDAETIRAISEGIFLADDLIAHTPLLKTVVGSDLKGHIRRAGVIFRFHGLCQRGDLPYEAEMVKMPYGNWHWLEIKSGQCKAHICRTLGIDEFPAEALSRQDARLVNQPDLFKEKILSLDEVAGRLRDLYAWLTFGVSRGGKLDHLCWAMPPADEGDYLALIDVLKRQSGRELSPPAPFPTEPPTPLIRLRFKDHIEEQILEKKKKEEDKK